MTARDKMMRLAREHSSKIDFQELAMQAKDIAAQIITSAKGDQATAMTMATLAHFLVLDAINIPKAKLPRVLERHRNTIVNMAHGRPVREG